MDKHQELIQKLINDITSENNSDASDTFNQVINAKLSDTLADKKTVIAQSVYSPDSDIDTEDLSTAESE